MKALSVLSLFAFTFLELAFGQSLDQIRKMEASGDIAGARAALSRAAEGNTNDSAALTNYAEFLERYADPATRQAYTRLLPLLRQRGDTAAAATIARRLAVLDLQAGDRESATRNLATLSGRNVLASAPARENWPTAPIPGPLRSFARMAAMPADTTPEEILPALARNVVTNGYQASHSNEELEQTEYLKLIHRYLSQARELDKLAGDKKTIEVQTCEAPNVAELLRILGFRMRGGCGSEVVLETVNATRAFLTTDSGFPLNDLEQALRTNRPFTYDYHPTLVPVLFGPEYWTGRQRKREGDPRLLSRPSSAIPPFAGCIWVSRSSTAKPPTRSAKQRPLPGFASTRTCSISSAACLKCATARRWFRAASAPPPCGRSWRAHLPTRAAHSSTSCWLKTMAGLPACSMPWRASAGPCGITSSNPRA